DLPVHAEGLLVVDLEAIHAHVAGFRGRIAREDERQRDVAPGIPRPAAQDGERAEVRAIGLHDLLTWPGAHTLGAGLGQAEEIAEPAQLVEERARHAEVERLGR